MASSSSSHRLNVEDNAFSRIEHSDKRRKVPESPKPFDVFINYRGPDVKRTLAIQLYNSFEKMGIRAVPLDNDLFPTFMESDVRSAAVNIAIFSKGYAESPWCLGELVFMLKTDAKIIPVFYGVNPSDLRLIEKGVYADAFSHHKEKGRYLKEWETALQTVSFMTGYESNGRDHQDVCKRIELAVVKELQGIYPLGVDELMKDFECFRSRDGKENQKIVGIFGMGGLGKTTLAKELLNCRHSQYDGYCFLNDVRETSSQYNLHSLQYKLAKQLFRETPPEFHSTEEGNDYLRVAFQRRDLPFLLVLDDIDHVEQLDALLHLDSMNSGSWVIVTTRDEQILIDAKIAIRYRMREMVLKYSRQLFCWHAFKQPDPPSDFKDLVDSFVEESGGLPMSLKVFGRLVRGEDDMSKWHFYLKEVRKQLSRGIKNTLQISLNALNEEEKNMFMDIACFFVDKPRSMAISIWESCGWNAEQALLKLERKSLVDIHTNMAGYDFDDKLLLKMNDHIRDLGREMSNDPSFPRRNWQNQSSESNGLQNILTETSCPSSRCLNSLFDRSMSSQITYFVGNLDQTRTALLWLELELDGSEQRSLPSWIPLQHLRSLRIFCAHLKELWRNNPQAPVHLKELVLHECSLAECTNSIGMLKDLEKLVLTGRNEGMLVDGQALSESLRGLTKLRSLVLRYFALSGHLTLKGYRCTSNLQTIEMCGINLVSTVSISGKYCGNLESVYLVSMKNLILVDLTLIETLNFLELNLCEKLKRVSWNFDEAELVTLNIVECRELEVIPSLKHLSCLERIRIDGCEKLQKITGVEELQELRYLHLSGGDILRCIHRLKKLPSEVTSAIGKANRQAKTILDTNQFCDMIGENTNRAINVSETGTILEESRHLLSSLSAVIICAVVRGSYASGTNPINIRLPSGLIQSNIGGGIWIVTIVITGEKDVTGYKELPTVGDDAQIKKRWIVTIKKDRGVNALEIFKKIIAQLYNERSVYL